MTTPPADPFRTQLSICPNPVFIIGAPRSGTTALAMALSQHSGFWTSDESFFMAELFGHGQLDAQFTKWSERPSSSWLRTQEVGRQEFFRSIGLGVNALFTSRSKGRRWIDQTPHHGLMADVLADMFPGALFLHVLRDGRQVVNSMIRVSTTLTTEVRDQMVEGGFLPLWACDFGEACKTWRQNTEVIMDFCAKHPERTLTVIHGRLESGPAAELARILEFLGAPHEEAPATYLASHRINSSYIPGGENPDIPYKRPEPWDAWGQEQRKIFAKDAGAALVRYGFAAPEEISL